jgi:hypothetical protein
MLRALQKGVRAHGTAGFMGVGSWLSGIFPGSCVIGVWVGPC